LIQQSKTAFIFPAFIHENPENPYGGSGELYHHFLDLVTVAASLIDSDPEEFDFVLHPFLWDELKTQYLTYIYSCAVADILEGKKMIASFSAGYSMGIYAAIVHARVVTFTDGLLLIKKAYEIIRNIVYDKKYAMCSIIGLSRDDINNLIHSLNLRVEITNQNSGFAFVLSGFHDEILNLLIAATAEGALHTHLLNVSFPYHSDLLKETKQVFRDFIETIRFAKPQTKLISLVDQHILEDTATVKEEIIRNLYTPLNWYKTQSELLRSGVNLFVECGPGKNLVKNSKFIEGEFKFYTACEYLKKLNTEQTDKTG
jgi:[acyl-carrier-protein] S-malonyltransferase